MPNDPEGQRKIVSEGLAAGMALTEPGFPELDYRYIDDDWKAEPLSWSRKQQDALGINAPGGDSAKPTKPKGGDTRTGRSAEPVWQLDEDAAAAAAVDWDEQCLVCIGLPEDARPS